MASSNESAKHEPSSGASSEEDLAQVWKDLQKGEKTAQVLESNLTNLEKKIDDLLASFEDSERRMVEEASAKKKANVKHEEGDDGPSAGKAPS